MIRSRLKILVMWGKPLSLKQVISEFVIFLISNGPGVKIIRFIFSGFGILHPGDRSKTVFAMFYT